MLLVALGVFVEIGWAFDIPTLKAIVPGFIAMNPTTALLLLAGAVVLLAKSFDLKAADRITLVVSVAMIAIGMIKDVGYFFDKNLPVDRLLFWSKLDPSGPFHGNALAPNAAACFVFVGLALPTFVAGKSKSLVADFAIVASIAVAATAFIGYAVSSISFYNLAGYSPMSLPTSFGFLLTGVGCIVLRPDHGIAKIFTQETLGSVLVRRVMPVATITPFMIGVTRAFVTSTNRFDPTTVMAIAMVSTMLMIAGLILGAANTLNATDRKRQEAERQMIELTERLRVAANTAEQANQSKSQFLANMSHEVRTPLNGVLGTTSLLESRPLEPDIRKLVGIIRSSGETLLRVIDDILDFSKIEAGKLEIESLPVNLSELVLEIVTLYKAQADIRGITISAIVPESHPAIVLSDPVRIKQVLGNLISNAVKFTSIGGVYVTLELKPSSSERACAVLTVRDTGIGIPEDRQKAIFDSFSQADSSTYRRYGGTGLGLAICKRIVDLMGGELSLTSRPQRGSTFTVMLDLPVGHNLPNDAAHTAAFSGKIDQRVLLAEDNEVNALVASSLLEDLGCSVVVVSDGVSAVAAMESGRFDTILMDIHMPICDGYEATRTIRATEKGRDVRIIALTASALFEDQQESLQAGMDGFLSKPFSRDGLIAALLLEKGPSTPSVAG